MALVTHVVTTVITPVVLVLALGGLAKHWLGIDARPFSRLTLYVLAPCLTFSAMSRSTIVGEQALRIFAFTMVSTLALWPLSSLVARGLHLDSRTTSAFHLSTMFGNIVNFGFPVLIFAFGQEAVEIAVIIMVAWVILISSLGVYLAARGRNRQVSVWTILGQPMLWGAGAGIAVNVLTVPVPDPLAQTAKLLGDIVAPLTLLTLGIQLAATRWGTDARALLASSAIRLGGGMLMGMGVATALGLQGLAWRTCVVEAATPTAVFVSILAVEYDQAPDFASGAILLSTILSLGSMTLLLSII